jgi:isopentenyl-diphosphate delta-isomerase
MNTNNTIINIPLVDSNGVITGYSEKMHVHRSGLLHLAFSLMIIRKRAAGIELLLQRRALHKYHSGGLWTNTCCSHPMVNESILAAAQRRVKEELGISTFLNLKEIAKIQYHYQLDNGLAEHEFNHLLIAEVNDVIWHENEDEVMEVKWWPVHKLAATLAAKPNDFTAWFPDVFRQVHAANVSF